MDWRNDELFSVPQMVVWRNDELFSVPQMVVRKTDELFSVLQIHYSTAKLFVVCTAIFNFQY